VKDEMAEILEEVREQSRQRRAKLSQAERDAEDREYEKLAELDIQEHEADAKYHESLGLRLAEEAAVKQWWPDRA
jgi:hypothetical protein